MNENKKVNSSRILAHIAQLLIFSILKGQYGFRTIQHKYFKIQFEY